MTQRSRPLRADQHFSNLHRWLEMEGEAERQRLAQRRKIQSSEAAERTGETLLDLVIRTHTTGLGGRYLITLVKRKSPDRLPWHRFKVGSPILLSDDNDEDGDTLTGVVSARRNESLEVAVDDWPSGDRFRLDLSPDEISRKRQASALQVGQNAAGRLGQLRDILLGDREPTFQKTVKLPA